MGLNDFITLTASEPKAKKPAAKKPKREKKPSFFTNIKSLFKKKAARDDFDDETDFDEGNVLFGSSLLYTDNPTDYNGQFSNVLGGQTLANRAVLVKKLQNGQDMKETVDNLRQGDPCVVFLDGVETALAQRYVDFLSGVIVALNGTIKQLDEEKYLLTPNGLGIK
ncbi:MAG: cell division protein SepF [Christensenellaceae bacterium]|jgi:FtsZ-interacting cell division protein YlmF|nr:cell division protein SepF [Christensenellaceae bacterium]